MRSVTFQPHISELLLISIKSLFLIPTEQGLNNNQTYMSLDDDLNKLAGCLRWKPKSGFMLID